MSLKKFYCIGQTFSAFEKLKMSLKNLFFIYEREREREMI